MSQNFRHVTLDHYLNHIKSKGHKAVKIFVVNRLIEEDQPVKNIHYWVNITASNYMLLKHMLHIAYPPTEKDLYDKNQRIQQNAIYMQKVIELQNNIEDKGFKTKIVDQMIV